MNRQEQNELKYLVKVNDSIRKDINNLIKPLNEINKKRLLDNIYNLIENELEQSTYEHE